MKRKFSIFALAILGMSITACGGSGSVGLDYDDSDLDIDTEWTEYSVPITKVNFDAGEDNIVIERGSTYEYSYTVEPKKAVKKSLTWESSNTDVVTVSQGVLTGVGAGKAIIYVSNNEKSFNTISLNVEVIVPVTDISFKQTTLLADLNKDYQLSVDYTPFDTTEKGVTWHVENEEIATISDNGLLTTKGEAGTVKVTANSAYINKTIEMTVEIADRTIYADEVIVDEFESSVEIGHNFTMKAHSAVSSDPTLKPTPPEVKYYSNDPEILSVEEDSGIVHALKAGNATIYATTIGKNGVVSSDHKSVNVFEVKVQSISLNDITLSNATKRSDFDLFSDGGLTYTTDKEGYPVASIPNFTYEVADTSVATVNTNGKVYAVAGIGSTSLTVRETRGGASKTVNLKVEYVATSLEVSGASEVEIGSSIKLSVSTTPSGVPAEYISFTSSDEDIATVSSSGVVTGVSSGEVEITVKAFDATKVVSIKVKNPAPQHQYYVVGIGGDWSSINESYALLPDLSDANHYYLGPVHLTANTEVKVYDYVNDAWIGSNEGYTEQGAYWKTTSKGNLLVLIEGDYYVDFYIQHDEGNHIKLFYKGSPDDPVYGYRYYVEGIGGVWSPVEQYGMKEDQTDPNHYYLGPITLEAYTEVKVFDVTNGAWIGSNSGYSEQPAYWTTTDEGNLKTLVAGDFYIDLRVEHNEGNHIKFYYDGGETPDEPDEPGYYVVGTTSNWKFAGSTKLNAGESGNLAQIIAYEAKAGEEFKVRSYQIEGGKDWYGVGEDKNQNYVVGDSDKLINIYINSSNELYVEDYVDPSNTKYYLTGTFTDPAWSTEDDLEFTVDAQDSNIYRLKDVSLEYGDVIKVFDPDLGDSGWYGVSKVYDNCHFVVGDNSNCIVFDKGTYDVTFYVSSEDGNHIQLSLHEPQEFDLNKQTKFTVINQTGQQFTGNFRSVKLHIFDITFANNSPITSVAGLKAADVTFGDEVWYNTTDGVIDVQMTWVKDDPATEFTVTLPAYIESCKICVYNSDNVWVHQVHFNEQGGSWIDGESSIFTTYRGYDYTLYLCNNYDPEYNAYIDGNNFNTPVSIVASYLPPNSKN